MWLVVKVVSLYYRCKVLVYNISKARTTARIENIRRQNEILREKIKRQKNIK